MERCLEFSSEVENLNKVSNLLDKILSEHTINEDNYGKIHVAVIEGVNNAIKHGNKSDKEKTVSFNCIVEESKIAFIVEDEGQGFDYQDVPDPTLPENIEKSHGRGLFLMRNLADEVNFFDEGRKVEIIFKL